MRAALLIVATFALAACSGGADAPVGKPEPQATLPAANFPAEPGDAQVEWDEFFGDTRVQRELVFPSDDSVQRVERRTDDLDSIRRGRGEGSGSPSFDGGASMSYDPELRRMGLKVGRDGQLHRVGHDARDPRDPDEGPVVGWDELHRKQFGH